MTTKRKEPLTMPENRTETTQVERSTPAPDIRAAGLALHAVEAEQRRCIELIAMVVMRPEQYAARLHPTDMADAMVWLIEQGYTPQNAPTYEERENLAAVVAAIAAELEPDPLLA